MDLLDLHYSYEALDSDIQSYLKTQKYAPSYAADVKAFLMQNYSDILYSFGERAYFCSLFSDDFIKEVGGQGNPFRPAVDRIKLLRFLQEEYGFLNLTNEDQNACVEVLEKSISTGLLSGAVVPYFVNKQQLLLFAVNGLSRNPIFSVYLVLCRWCKAMQFVREDLGDLSEIHSNVFANVFLYIKAVETGHTPFIQEMVSWIINNSAAMVAGGKPEIRFFDFPATKEALSVLHKEGTKGFYFSRGLDFSKIYDFCLNMMQRNGIQHEEVLAKPAELLPERRRFIEKKLSEAQKERELSPPTEQESLEGFFSELVRTNGSRECFDFFKENVPHMTPVFTHYQGIHSRQHVINVKVMDRLKESRMKFRNERERS